MKMTTYPGMHLGGEVRESISLDEDDLSDVEDEVFIRDGKNGYKLAEELNVKRPLMAPRRKPKPDLTTRLRSRPPCRAFCKPCCYVLAALSTLIGLITLVVILVSIFPLPLDRLRDWIINKSKPEQASNTPKLLPCNNLKVIDVWSSSLPFLTSESPVRLLDINNDGSQDIIFGFGTGENHEILKDETFCQVFLKMSSPCDGGIIALNGVNGEILWKHWLNDTIFDLHCTADINKDNFDDCLAVGKHGTIIVINSKNGSTIWQLNTGRNNVFVGNFISDQNNDNISDIVMSHSALKGGNGHILLLSGLTGEEIKRIPTPGGAKTFYMPQLIKQTENNSYILYGTGTPMKSGNLSIVPIEVLKSEYLMNNTITIYKDPSNGMMTQSVLVDITGDHIPDIITAMYNSSVVAINGKTLKQIWNFTIENGETKIVPTPGYFNSDNVTDFLVIYQKRDNILNYNYTQTYIIDGKLGKSIYQPTGKSVISQMNGILLSAEGFGFDSYVFWTVECKQNEKLKSETENIDCLKRLNESSIFRLNALNQYHEPPGFQIYSSEDKSNEFSNAKSALKLLREYYDNIPKNNYNPGQTEVNDNYNVDPRPIDIKKYGASSFRHKDNRNGLLNNPEPTYDQEDYSQEEFVPEFNVFDDLYNQNQKYSLLNSQDPPVNNRDPRSKEKKINTASTIKDGKSKKKNLSDKKYGIYGYQNIKNARSRLLHDVNDLPKDILRDTYFKNEEMKLKKSKFEQRDINSHKDKIKENEEIRKIIENEKKATQNMSLNLWDLESEKETLERESGYWRGKRDLNDLPNKIRKISSVGAVLNPINMTNDTILNEIDVVFIVYWQPNFTQKELLHYDIQECVDERMEKQSAMDESQKLTVEQETNNCKEEQTSLKRISNFFDVLHKLKLGQMTVYRITVKCECEKVDNKKERCARFLPYEYQSWPQYLGKLGDGAFLERKQKN